MPGGLLAEAFGLQAQIGIYPQQRDLSRQWCSYLDFGCHIILCGLQAALEPLRKQLLSARSIAQQSHVAVMPRPCFIWLSGQMVMHVREDVCCLSRFFICFSPNYSYGC